jgi:hypothetical protein
LVKIILNRIILDIPYRKGVKNYNLIFSSSFAKNFFGKGVTYLNFLHGDSQLKCIEDICILADRIVDASPGDRYCASGY